MTTYPIQNDSVELEAARWRLNKIAQEATKPRIVLPYPNWMRDLSRQTRRNAMVRGIDYRLTDDDLAYLTERCGGRCEISGIAFDFALLGRGKRNPFRPSLDRKDSQRGYERRNMRVVCNIANMAMNEWGEEPLRNFVRAMVKNIGI